MHTHQSRKVRMSDGDDSGDGNDPDLGDSKREGSGSASSELSDIASSAASSVNDAADKAELEQPTGAASDEQNGTPSNVSGLEELPSQGVGFNPPESVQKWLRREDWDALSQAFAEAEERAMVWTEDGTRESVASTSPSSVPRRRRRRQWDQDFHLLGQDSRKPPPLRRYFDPVAAEGSPPTQAVRRGMRHLTDQNRGNGRPLGGSASAGTSPAIHRSEWSNVWGQTASVNNDVLHPYLRHYFDRRGLEASYRQRPHIDHESCRRLRPRTPQRPSVGDLLLRHSTSEPSLASAGGTISGSTMDKLDVKNRVYGSIHWGNRCLMYGPEASVQRSPTGDKIPWINDHHRNEAEDNELLNPMLRHYFDADGIESSFRNRGRHYGRPTRSVFGQSPKMSSLTGGRG